MLSRSPVQNLQEDMSTSWWVNTDTIPFVLFKVARISGARDPAEDRNAFGIWSSLDT